MLETVSLTITSWFNLVGCGLQREAVSLEWVNQGCLNDFVWVTVHVFSCMFVYFLVKFVYDHISYRI